MRTTNTLAALSAFFLIAFGQIDTAQAENGKAEVSISAEVKEQIQKLSPDEHKRIEAAIKVGNQYAPYHFDGTAYQRDDNQQEVLWQKNIRPLIAPLSNKGNWYAGNEVYDDSSPQVVINGVDVQSPVVCPWPELISANVIDGRFELKYRTRIIGMWKATDPYRHMQEDILLNEKEDYDEVLVVLNKDNKVIKAHSKYKAFPTVPQTGIEMQEAHIKWPPMRIFQGPNGVDQETEEQARARIPQYKRYIELIKSEEAAACGGTSVNTTQTHGKE